MARFPMLRLFVVVVAGVFSLLFAAEADAARRVLAESFERPLVGWRSQGATLERVRTGARGRGAARLVATRAGRSFALVATPPPVPSTLAGTLYRSRARVRAAQRGRRICMHLQERRSRHAVGGPRTCVRATTRWQHLPWLPFRARVSGRALTLSVRARATRPGDTIEVDAVALTSSRRRVAPPLPEVLPGGEPFSMSPDPTTRTGDPQRSAPPSPDPLPGTAAFPTLPPGSPLPGDAECEVRVNRHPWEPRPRNAPANRTRGVRLSLPGGSWDAFPSWRALSARVDGDFTGTTDEILQWASCKWGFDVEVTRAQAQVETGWDQDYVGDEGQSVGLLQVKSAVEGSPHRYTWPLSRTSTAFNVDYALAWRRACYEGHFVEGGWLPRASRGDLWGCVGLWFSGRWGRDQRDYVTAVRTALRERAWSGRDWPRP